jgi:Mrp family chromosome partitioning ATPase
MHAQYSASSDSGGFGALAGALRRALVPLLAAALAAGLASYFVLSLLTPQYAARARIEIVAKGGDGLHLHREAIGSHVRALMSTDLAVRVAAELGLAGRPEFNAALAEPGAFGRLLRGLGLAGSRAGESAQDRVFDAYYRALRVSRLADGPAILVEFRSADPRLAADAANKLVELYRDDLAMRALLETLDGRARLATAVEVKTLARAEPPAEQAWPKVGAITLLAVAASLLLGSAMVVVREAFAMQREVVGGARATHPPRPAGRVRAPISMQTMPALARRLIADAGGRVGFRTLVVGETAGADVGAAAVELARALARQQRQVILLDWSLDGVGLARELGVSPTLGITDVLSGRAAFEDVIERLPGAQAHVIPAGSSTAGAAVAADRDRVAMLLDALDEAYEHVLITGAREAVRDLFTTIERRIDVAIVVAGAGSASAPASPPGFDVADLEVIRYEPVAEQQGGASLLTLRAALI